MAGLLYLSASDIASLDIGVADIHDCVGAMFRDKSAGRTLMKPKLSIPPRPGYVVEALVGAALDVDTAGCKWLGVSKGNARRGLPTINATILLSGIEDGQPRTIMNGSWVTGVRTAACTALAAEHLAPAGARTVSFIGCGLQARTHLAALRHVRPTLTRVVAFSRRRSSAESFAAHCAELGLRASVTEDPRAAVEAGEMVISTVPPSGDLRPFLDAGWLVPGAFAGAVDLGRSWIEASWQGAFGFVATDDLEQSETRGRNGVMLVPDRFDAELGDLAQHCADKPPSSDQRTAMLFSGISLADIAVARLVEARAREQGVGIELER
ncbi:ornithine cyclodeaminase family protein [Alloyangia pacifica]|uniref:Ornithine cyclodeaminase n=1 Tax=Alloyangia pacifica TaxID=311180 RepID=A0A1I6UV17_9RHOB|nr:ornithine cyclodeaminase family protein [Alloyangia pacifica]SDI54242.1 ornithine cyclodeaminase [Alloyangia pacifica]SFT05240.1 ornithine cyclodeaminase [Alloyangia pacifica]